MENKSLLLIAALALFALLPTSTYAYTTRIHAPAVLQNQDMGALTLISLNLTRGTGTTRVIGPSYVDNSTLDSALTASRYAASYLNVNYSKYNFTYAIDGTENVSGPSAGLAFTLLADYALGGKQLYNNFSITGTLSQDGSVGPVGGVYDKVWAASLGGIKYFVAPVVPGGTSEQLIYYLAQQTFNMPLVEVGNFTGALPYAGGINPRAIAPVVPNVTHGYDISRITNAPLNCTNCDEKYFGELTNFTFGLVNASLAGIESNYSGVSSQLAGQLSEYRNISARGYLYTGADLAFESYPYAVTLDNAPAFTNQSTGSTLLNDVNSYCSQISVPQMTDRNYEYIVGGEVRQAFAAVNLQNAYSQLNASQSTDDVIDSVSTAAQSYAWCSAAQEMYTIAGQLGGAPVVESTNLQLAASGALQNATKYPGIYLQAAQLAYNSSEYSAALYAADYAQTLQNPTYLGSVTGSEISSITATAYSSTYGVWPTQFSDSALFWLQEAQLGGPNAVSYLNSAYSLSNLASALSAQNRFISANLVPQASDVSSNRLILNILMNQSQQISSLKSSLENTYNAMAFFVVLIVLAWAVIFFLFAKELGRLRTAKARAATPRRRAKRRARR